MVVVMSTKTPDLKRQRWNCRKDAILGSKHSYLQQMDKTMQSVGRVGSPSVTDNKY